MNDTSHLSSPTTTSTWTTYNYNITINRVELVPASTKEFEYERHHTIKSDSPLTVTQLSELVKSIELELSVDQPQAYEGEYEITEYSYTTTISTHTFVTNNTPVEVIL